MNKPELPLSAEYSLRKQDDNTWWLQHYGMDTLRVEASVPCGPGGSIDAEVRAFTEALRATKAALPEDLAGLVRQLRYGAEGYGHSLSVLRRAADTIEALNASCQAQLEEVQRRLGQLAAAQSRAEAAEAARVKAEGEWAMAEDAENLAKDCFWAVYPTYVKTTGRGISPEAARTELAARAEAAEASRDALVKAVEPFAAAWKIWKEREDRTVFDMLYPVDLRQADEALRTARDAALSPDEAKEDYDSDAFQAASKRLLPHSMALAEEIERRFRAVKVPDETLENGKCPTPDVPPIDPVTVERCRRTVAKWKNMPTLKLRAGEMTVQETRTVIAVLTAIDGELRALAETETKETGG